MLINHNGGGRKSNIELLRLVSMLMVLNLHSFCGTEYGEGLFRAFDFFRESTSICAVNVFILISGYFGIRWKFKSFFSLAFQVLFYCFTIYLFCVAIGIEEYTTKGLLKQSLGIMQGYGFITRYIILYFLAPVLNAFVEKVSSRTLFLFIITLFIAENFVFHRMDTNFFLLYLIGRLIYVTQSVERLNVNATKAYWLTTFLIFICCYALFMKFQFTPAQLQAQKLIFGLSYASPLVILQAIFLFLCFARFNITSRFINWCSSSCLAIFLIHMHPLIKGHYYNYVATLYNQPILIHLSLLILLFCVIFVGSILVDKIRIFVSDFVFVKTGKLICKWIPVRYQTIDTYIPNVIIQILK